MDKNRFNELMAEATVDCYDEEEAFWSMFYTLDDKLTFPLSAQALGETITVLGLDGSYSGLRAGITARVRKGEQEYRVGLVGLDFVDPDPVSAEWLDVYRRWAEIE